MSITVVPFDDELSVPPSEEDGLTRPGWLSVFACSVMNFRHVLEPGGGQWLSPASYAITAPLGSNYNAVSYKKLRSMVATFASMHPDEGLYIDQETRRGGDAFLDLAQEYSFPPPKVFAHGGDALVFTWELDNIRRFLTTDCGKARLQDFRKGGDGSLVDGANFDLTHGRDVFELTRRIGGQAWKQLRLDEISTKAASDEA